MSDDYFQIIFGTMKMWLYKILTNHFVNIRKSVQCESCYRGKIKLMLYSPKCLESFPV